MYIKVTKDYEPDLDLVMKGISLNEVSNNEKVIYRFSDAKLGNSGYSFGRSQFDVKNNKTAVRFLEEKCGFTEKEILRLLTKDKNISDLNEKLLKCKDLIDEFDKSHIKEMVEYVKSLDGLPLLESEKTFIQLVDYHNQLRLDRNGRMHKWLKSNKLIKSVDILVFKLNNTKWGKEQPQDVKRRYHNIEKM